MKDILKIEGYELLNQKVYQVLKKYCARHLEPCIRLSENKISKTLFLVKKVIL